jgi:hypothetical protein
MKLTAMGKDQLPGTRYEHSLSKATMLAIEVTPQGHGYVKWIGTLINFLPINENKYNFNPILV